MLLEICFQHLEIQRKLLFLEKNGTTLEAKGIIRQGSHLKLQAGPGFQGEVPKKGGHQMGRPIENG